MSFNTRDLIPGSYSIFDGDRHLSYDGVGHNMPFSLRLDAETEAKIRRLAAATRRSKSEVVREAVAHYAPDVDPVGMPGQSAFDRLKPFIGSVATGGANLSRDTHAKYRALLRRKHGPAKAGHYTSGRGRHPR
jgi:predicted DNA-binding protein